MDFYYAASRVPYVFWLGLFWPQKHQLLSRWSVQSQIMKPLDPNTEVRRWMSTHLDTFIESERLWIQRVTTSHLLFFIIVILQPTTSVLSGLKLTRDGKDWSCRNPLNKLEILSYPFIPVIIDRYSNIFNLLYYMYFTEVCSKKRRNLKPTYQSRMKLNTGFNIIRVSKWGEVFIILENSRLWYAWKI